MNYGFGLEAVRYWPLERESFMCDLHDFSGINRSKLANAFESIKVGQLGKKDKETPRAKIVWQTKKAVGVNVCNTSDL